jgi:hypothetical protein
VHHIYVEDEASWLGAIHKLNSSGHTSNRQGIEDYAQVGLRSHIRDLNASAVVSGAKDDCSQGLRRLPVDDERDVNVRGPTQLRDVSAKRAGQHVLDANSGWVCDTVDAQSNAGRRLLTSHLTGHDGENNKGESLHDTGHGCSRVISEISPTISVFGALIGLLRPGG